METHKTYVTYEQAMLMKDLGFDWPCDHHYTHTQTLQDNYPIENFNEDNVTYCSAPSLSVAQRWLREVKGIAINVIAHDGGFYQWEEIYLPDAPEYECFFQSDIKQYTTYETALSNALDAVLNLLNNQNDHDKI